MTAIERAAECLTSLRYTLVPDAVRSGVDRSLLDTLVVSLAAHSAEGVPALRDWAIGQDARGDCTVWGTDARVSASNAALINAVAASALELDSLRVNVHADAVVLPAVFAAAERANSSGEQLLTAFLAGTELVCRMGAFASTEPTGWSFTSIYGVFGAAAGAAMLLSDDPKHVSEALGLALSMAAGSQQANSERVLAKRLQPGLASRNGVLAAEMACMGFTSPRGGLDGRFGLGALYHQIDFPALFSEWGTKFYAADTGTKKFPVCAASHASMQACHTLMADHSLDATEVQSIQLALSPFAFRMVGAPFHTDGNLQVMGQYSIQYGVACMAVRGGMSLRDLESDAVRAPDIKAFIERIEVVEDTSNRGELVPATVTIKSTAGRTYAKTLSDLPGAPGSPMSDAEVTEKLIGCFPDQPRDDALLTVTKLRRAVEGLQRQRAIRTFWADSSVSDQD